MPVPLQDLLKYVVIVLVWLMFLRISRAIWVEVRSDTRRMSKTKAPEVSAVARVEGPTKLKQAVDQPIFENSTKGAEVLELQRTDGTKERFSVNDEVTIGRAGGCSIRLDDSYVSSIHARIWRETGGLFIADLASTNGTLVNSKKITTKMTLHEGDLIEVGKHRFVVSS